MYLDCTVKIPSEPGKISRFKKGNVIYVRYTVGRTYNPEKKYNVPDHKTIGKPLSPDSTLMIPNENYLKYFGDAEIPETTEDSSRSSCVKVGAFAIIRKIIEEYDLLKLLMKNFDPKESGLILDLAAYSIVSENNAGQYYPDYTYNHPSFTENMKQYSDSSVSNFLSEMADDQRIGFLNEWNASRDHRERIYISYDSTNKNCQAGDIEMVEYGHAKDEKGLPVFGYAVGYDVNNEVPLFYEKYPGSINDVSQLQIMLEKIKGYGYRHVGFILDRGYFSKGNIEYMDENGYDFVIMVKGMAKFVRSLVEEVHGAFENKRDHSIRKHKLYGSDKQERYFHVYYSDIKASAERENLEARIEKMKHALDSIKGKQVQFSGEYTHYFKLEIYDKDGTFIGYRENKEVIEKELELCGYFVIVTSRNMTAKEAIDLYKSRDTSEKLFRGDKSYLGNKSLRNHGNESASSKIFVEFIALIIRCRIYTLLQKEKERLDKTPNFMTVPAAIKELEKIEMIKGIDGKYRLDHAVTKNQKMILSAFKMDPNSIRKYANELSEMLCKSAFAKGEEQ
jgi:transposase